MEFFEHSVFFGVSLSLLAYGLGVVLQKRFRLALFNPLLLSVIVTILVLVTAHIDYEVYYAGAKYLSYLLTPATVCLAVPLEGHSRRYPLGRAHHAVQRAGTEPRLPPFA